MKTYKTTEAERARARAYYWANRDKMLVATRLYRENNTEARREYFRKRQPIRTAQRRAWNEANRDKQRAVNVRHHLKREHGMTVEQYSAMVEAQNGRCAICRQPPTGNRHCGKLHVDHNHENGQIRALLCADCNRAIGLMRERPERLTAAAWYLERHRHLAVAA
jgi:recombination endonuclease VII